jgi:N utilization substance protein B
LAVQLLYSLEINPNQNVDESLNAFTKWGAASVGIDEDAQNYMVFLVKGVWGERPDIDDVLRKVVTGWRIERMVAVDRAVLRVAIFEGFLKGEVPVAVAISEAVELARVFGTEDSGRFVNGVLAKVLRFMEGEKRTGHNDENHAVSIPKNPTDS